MVRSVPVKDQGGSRRVSGCGPPPRPLWWWIWSTLGPGARLRVGGGSSELSPEHGGWAGWPRQPSDLLLIYTILIRENNKVKVCKYCAVEVAILHNTNKFAMRFTENQRNLGNGSFLGFFFQLKYIIITTSNFLSYKTWILLFFWTGYKVNSVIF